MKDIDIRQALFAGVFKDHQAEPDTLVVEELGLNYGEVRVDVAVINGSIHGYEIKSQKDTLERLPAQLTVYSASLDYVTLVVHESHVTKALEMIPRWWGVQVVKGTPEAVQFKERRKSRRNPKQDLECTLRLLWKDEAIQILENAGLAKGIRSKSKEVINKRILESLQPDAIRDNVRAALKGRTQWRNVINLPAQAQR